MMILPLFFSLCILRTAYCTDAKETDDKVISNMQRVKDKVFANYDKDVRPEYHHDHTTTVDFEIVPGYIVELDEEKSLFTMDSWLVFVWNDKRLAWNATEFDGLTHLSLPDHKVWQPDIRVYNGHSSDIDPMKNTPIMLFSSGTVIWVPPSSVIAFCDVTTPTGSYPYDVHECNITLGSWSHNGWQIDINIYDEGKIHWDHFSNTNPIWEVDKEKCRVVKTTIKYECCEEPYQMIDATMVLKRRPPANIQVILVPCILVMILTLAMFWIPSDSGKKITLGASLLLILSALTIYCAAMTKSPRTPLLAVSFVQSTMIAVAIAVFLEIVVINLSNISGPRRPPQFLVSLLSGYLGNFILIWAPWKQSIAGDKIRLHEDAEPINTEPTPKQEWFVMATGFDRLLFVVYIIIFAAIHQV